MKPLPIKTKQQEALQAAKVHKIRADLIKHTENKKKQEAATKATKETTRRQRGAAPRPAPVQATVQASTPSKLLQGT